MALVRLSDYGDIEQDPCSALDQLSGSIQIVVSDDPDDFYDGSPCNLGRILRASSEIVGGNYKVAVLDTSSNCLGWIVKPADPVYDSSSLSPWMQMAEQEIGVDSGNCAVFAGTRTIAHVKPPYFSVATKLMVFWTVLFHGTSPSDQCKWHPHWGDLPVDGDVGTPLVSDIYIKSPLSGQWGVSTFSAVVDHPAGETEKVLSAIVNGTVGQIHAIICAYAVSA